MPAQNTSLRKEAIRLRTEEHLSLNEILARLPDGVARSTCFGWIKDFKLPERRMQARRKKNATAMQRRKVDLGPPSSLAEMASEHDYSPLEQGAIAEAAAMLRMTINRWKVLRSSFDGDVVDFYATRHKSNKMVKVQVRTARPVKRHGHPVVSLRRMHNGRTVRFNEGDFDILIGYCLHNDTAYVWTYDEVAELKCSVSVSDDCAEAWYKLDDAA